MENPGDFSFLVVRNACDGAAALRDRIVAWGIDVATIADLVGCSPAALARATKTGATPRGMLIGLASLVTVLDLLAERGLSAHDVGRSTPKADTARAEIAAASSLAADMLDRLRRALAASDPGPTQLRLGPSTDLAA